MLSTLLLASVLGFGIGISLGLLGGGGSILTVPALVYVLGLSPQAAVTTSLAIVGANSTLGAAFHRAQGTLNWRVAALFGGTGMGVAYLAAGVSENIAPAVLMASFAALMIAVGGVLLRPSHPAAPQDFQAHEAESIALWKLILTGALVGLLTGLLGVGGGFLIVPALVMLLGLPMHQAIGTSLAVIAMNSAAGFLGHLGGLHLDLGLMSIFILAGLGGTWTGARLGRGLEAEVLRRAFALFIILLGLLLLYDNLPQVI
jgi:uncharacterized membrane protein YfcA